MESTSSQGGTELQLIKKQLADERLKKEQVGRTELLQCSITHNLSFFSLQDNLIHYIYPNKGTTV